MAVAALAGACAIMSLRLPNAAFRLVAPGNSRGRVMASGWPNVQTLLVPTPG
jgi:hypothetical protein